MKSKRTHMKSAIALVAVLWSTPALSLPLPKGAFEALEVASSRIQSTFRFPTSALPVRAGEQIVVDIAGQWIQVESASQLTHQDVREGLKRTLDRAIVLLRERPDLTARIAFTLKTISGRVVNVAARGNEPLIQIRSLSRIFTLNVLEQFQYGRFSESQTLRILQGLREAPRLLDQAEFALEANRSILMCLLYYLPDSEKMRSLSMYAAEIYADIHPSLPSEKSSVFENIFTECNDWLLASAETAETIEEAELAEHFLTWAFRGSAGMSNEVNRILRSRFNIRIPEYQPNDFSWQEISNWLDEIVRGLAIPPQDIRFPIRRQLLSTFLEREDVKRIIHTNRESAIEKVETYREQEIYVASEDLENLIHAK